MDTLRTLVSSLSHFDPGANDMSPEGRYRTSVTLTAQVGDGRGDCRAHRERRRHHRSRPGPEPRGELPLHADREAPEPARSQALDVALVLHADHEFNASTFAARVAAATLTDVHSAVTAAIGALKGPLHGGANTDVMNLLLEIGQDATDQKVEEIVRAKLARKEKIPGFGHRVYRTEDPRATHLRKMSEELCRGRATGAGSRCRRRSSRS